MALIILALSLPAFVLAQQKRDQSNSSAGVGTTSKSGPPASAPMRRPRTHNPGNAVAATFENAPASGAGLRFGDRIDEVDGVSMHGKSSAEVRDKIRGPRDSHVKLTITHASTGKTDQVEIVRAAVPQPSVPDAYMI